MAVRARGLGAMTLPSHGEDREFKSLRAHFYLESLRWTSPTSSLS